MIWNLQLLLVDFVCLAAQGSGAPSGSFIKKYLSGTLPLAEGRMNFPV